VETLEVSLGARSYPICIGPGLLRDADLLRASVDAAQVLIVTNDVVAPLYLDAVQQALKGRELQTVVLPDGEQHKTLATLSTILDRLVGARFHRDACLLALGGGVVGDIAGFAAACYQRGIRFVQVPTTLLAQVDSSVGGKTAVNHPQAKNMIGAFHQPSAVLADTDTLKTLPSRELSAGLAEVIKYGLILDESLFGWLEHAMADLLALNSTALTRAIRRSCEIKAEIVAEDEHERGRRALLNLGHTFGHALEAVTGYQRWLHGEAVAIGMHLAARTSAQLDWISGADCDRVDALLTAARLPVRVTDISADDVLARMKLDKKADRHGVKLVLLERIGCAIVTAAPEQSLLRAVIEADRDPDLERRARS
jgi:3-dehydroquinate synthase